MRAVYTVLICFICFSCFGGEYCSEDSFERCFVEKKIKNLKKMIATTTSDNVSLFVENGVRLTGEQKKFYQNDIDSLYLCACIQKKPNIAFFLEDLVSDDIKITCPMQQLFPKIYKKNEKRKKREQLRKKLDDEFVVFWQKYQDELSEAPERLVQKIFEVKNALVFGASLDTFASLFFSREEISQNTFLQEYGRVLSPHIFDFGIKLFVEKRCALKKKEASNPVVKILEQTDMAALNPKELVTFAKTLNTLAL